MMSTAPNPSFIAPGKRRKIGIACSTCRARKTACDGQRPHCSFCVSRGQEDTCVYEHVESASKKRKSTSDVKIVPVAQSERERVLPPLPQHNLPMVRRPSPPVIRDERPASATGRSALQNAREAMRAASQSKRTTEARASAESSSSQDEVDGFATVKMQDDPEDVLCGPYFGASSSAAFAQKLAGPSAAPADAPPASHHPRPARLPQKIRESDDRAAVFPRRNLADEYVRCYFDYYHPLFPVLHQPSFMSKYNKFWASENSATSAAKRTDLEEAILLSTINLVLALGCRYSTSVQYGDRTAVASEFFERSQRVFNYDPLDITSLSVVQLLLLQVAYLQLTTSATRCWNVMGLAVRMAQSLGLHMEPADVRREAKVSRRVRRRVWQCCIAMDWLGAATFGRPSMIAVRSQQQDTVMLEGECKVPIGDEPSPEAFQYTFELFGLLEEICNHLYVIPNQPTGDNTTQMLNDILNLNNKLDTYLESVPKHMKDTLRDGGPNHNPVRNSPADEIIEQTLSYRFLYMRTLLLRPLLLLPFERESRYAGARLDHAFARQGAALCVDTASRIINGLHATIDDRYNRHNSYGLAGWHVTYMIFTAATTLLAASQSRWVTSIPELEALLDRTTNILNKYTRYEPVAKRALRALQHLEKQILRQPSASHQQHQQPLSQSQPQHQQQQQPPPPTAPSPLPPLHDNSGLAAGLWTPDSIESAVDIGGDPTLWTQDLGELWDDSAWNPSSWLGQQLFMPGLLPMPE